MDTAIVKQSSPFAVHASMFLSSIIGLGTLDQQNEWFSRAYNTQIFGTYAQV